MLASWPYIIAIIVAIFLKPLLKRCYPDGTPAQNTVIRGAVVLLGVGCAALQALAPGLAAIVLSTVGTGVGIALAASGAYHYVNDWITKN